MRKHGHSILEMLIVLAILAGMVSLVWPSINKCKVRAHLSGAAQEISTDFSNAKLKAMQLGTAQVMRVHKNSPEFEIKSLSEEPSEDDEQKELPEGVSFSIEKEDSEEWVNVALFYPDGATSTNMKFSLREDDMCIPMNISDLTNLCKGDEIYKSCVESEEE